MPYRYDTQTSLSKRPNNLPLRTRIVIVVGWFIALALIVAAFA
jgi:hypothetical protein